MCPYHNYNLMITEPKTPVNYDASPGDRIYFDVPPGRYCNIAHTHNVEIASTFPNGVYIINPDDIERWENDESLRIVFGRDEYCSHSITYDRLREFGAYYTALRLKWYPDNLFINKNDAIEAMALSPKNVPYQTASWHSLSMLDCIERWCTARGLVYNILGDHSVEIEFWKTPVLKEVFEKEFPMSVPPKEPSRVTMCRPESIK